MAKISGFVNRRSAMLGIASALAMGKIGAINTAEPAPSFHAKTMDGETFNNESLKGKVVLLQFWATWCQYCRREQEMVDEISKDYADKGLVVLAVNTGESKKKVKKYLEESPRSCKIVLMEDTNLAAIFAARSFPLYIVIDKLGSLSGRQQGAAGEAPLLRMLQKAGIETA